MISKILRYLNFACVQISAPEIISFVLSISAYCLAGSVACNLYLWIIMLICDLLVLGAHGAWLGAGHGESSRGPWLSPTPFLTRFICVSVLVFLVTENQSQSTLATYLWYIMVVSAICHAFYCVLLAMHKNDPSWLAGTNGRIGVPNWISIARMALSILVPHLYAAQPFGKASSLIATVTLVLAMSTDAADGFIARHFNQTTKAGKALDPLGDKVIFYPTAVAFIIATRGTGFLELDWMRWVLYAALAVMFIRDALFFVWFFLYYKKLGKGGIGAGIVDKVRMAAMCAWLALSALAMTFPAIQTRMALAGLFCICIVAALSIASVFVDYQRMQPLLHSDDESSDGDVA